MAHPGIDLLRTFLGDRSSAVIAVADRRADLEALAGVVPAPHDVTVTPTTVGARRAERLVPPTITGPGIILYLHGGGYVSGSLDTHRGLAGRLALASGRPVVNLEYRLGPEHPFPAGLHDALAAVREIGADGPIAVAGDSAGGGLTLATLLVCAIEQGGPQPVAGVCFSPWSDLTQSGGSYQSRGDVDPMLSAASLQDMADHYLQGHDPTDPLASPMLADGFALAQLPPLRIDVGDAEVLLDDSIVLAERVRAAGGDVTLTIWPDLIHVFPAFPAEVVPEADECLALAGGFLASQLTDRNGRNAP